MLLLSPLILFLLFLNHAVLIENETSPSLSYHAIIENPEEEIVKVEAVFTGRKKPFTVSFRRDMAFARLEKPLLNGPVQTPTEGGEVKKLSPFTWKVSPPSSGKILVYLTLVRGWAIISATVSRHF